MKAIRIGGLLALLAMPLSAGISLSSEIHILDVEIVSCSEPSIQNIPSLPRVIDVSDQQALAALPPGRMIRARVLRSRVVESFFDDLWPSKVHEWQIQNSRRPTVFFFPVHVPAGARVQDLLQPVCQNLKGGSKRLMYVTTASDCDTTGRMDLCVFQRVNILFEPTEHERQYAAEKRPN